MRGAHRKKIFSIKKTTVHKFVTVTHAVFLLLIFFSLVGLLGRWSLKFAYATPPSATPLDTWMPDNYVEAITEANDKLYMAGPFTYWGPKKGNAYPISKSTGAPLSGYPTNIAPDVKAIIPDGNGGWFVGGNIRSSGTSQNSLYHIASNGSIDTSFNAQLSSTGVVYDMVLSGGILYVGGTFTTIGGQSRNNIAAIDPTTGTALSWNPGTSGTSDTVYALELSGDTLYVGGTFTTAGGQTRNRAAAFSISTGNLLSWDPNVTGFPYTVRDIKVNGTTVYLGGEFTAVNSTTRNRLAAVDATTGALQSWNPNSNGTVYDMYFDGTYLYVAGGMSQVGGATTRKGILRYETSTPSAPTLDTWDPMGSTNASVFAIASDGSDLYIGGSFSGTVGGQTRINLASVSQTTGLANSWNPKVGSYPRVLSLSGSTVYIGNSGYLMSPGGFYTTGKLVEFNTSTGIATDLVIPSAGSFSGAEDMVVNGTTLYIAGNFSGVTINGVSRSYMAAIDMNTWQFTSWDPQANGRVRDIEIQGNNLYVAGDFTSLGGNGSVTRLGRFALSTGSIDSSWLPTPNNKVYTIAVSSDESKVYLGGEFTQIDSASRSRIGAVDGTTGLATAWNPNASAGCSTRMVEDMALSGSTLYVGGCFTTIGGASRNYLAALDTTVNTNNATSWNPDPDDEVSELEVMSGTVYFGGWFYTVGGASHEGMAAADASTGAVESWSASLGENPFNGYASKFPYNIYASGGSLFVGGDFHGIGFDLNSNLSNFSDFSFQQYFAEFGTYTPPSTPTVAFSSTAGSGAESVANPTITVALSATSASNVTVNYTVTGTASGGGVDYTLANGTATITAGNLSTTIPLVITNDSDVESDETVIITLSSPSNATLGTNTVYTYTITNDDTAPTPTPSSSSGGQSGGGNGPIVGVFGTTTIHNTVTINNGEGKIYNPHVKIKITATPPVRTIVISRNQNFLQTEKKESPFDSEYAWNVCDTSTCPSGFYDVFVKFLDGNNAELEIVHARTELESTSSVVHMDTVTPKTPPEETPSVPLPESDKPEAIPLKPAIPLDIPEEVVSIPPQAPVSNQSTFADRLLAYIDELSATVQSLSQLILDNIPYLGQNIKQINTSMAYVATPVTVALSSFVPIQEQIIRLATGKDTLLVVQHGVQSFLAFLGFRRKRRYWGTVYDSKNKQPIDPAIVQLIDAKTGAVVEEAITDMAGRFGFLTRTGTFFIRAEKTHYVFPSKIVDGQTDEIFDNVYHGETFTVSDTSQIIAPNIPMDAEAFDWNQLDKRRVITFHPRWEYVIAFLSKILFFGGLIVSLLAFGAEQTRSTMIVVLFYGMFGIITYLASTLRLWGRIFGHTNMPQSDVILELVSPKYTDVVLSKAISTSDGKFFLKAEQGMYELHIKKQIKSKTTHTLKVLPIKIGNTGVFNKDIWV